MDAEPPVEPPVEEPPVDVEPPVEPLVAEPPLDVEPPAEPPVAEPPVDVEPPVEPLVAEPPLDVEPPAEPPVAEPPLDVEPPVEPPVAEPPLDVEPPVEPPVKEPPVDVEPPVEPPVKEPPTDVEPPVEPPVKEPLLDVEPPITEPPIEEAPPAEPPVEEAPPAEPPVEEEPPEEPPVEEEPPAEPPVEEAPPAEPPVEEAPPEEPPEVPPVAKAAIPAAPPVAPLIAKEPPEAAPPEAPPVDEEPPEEEPDVEPPEEEDEVAEEEPLALGLVEDEISLDKISLFAQLTYLNFISKFVFLPTDWSLPIPGLQFEDAFKAFELWVPPNSPLNLFREITLNKYHVDTAKIIGKEFEVYIKDICDAICDAIVMWTTLSMFTGVVINGPVGNLMQGGLMGPPLLPFILMSAPMDTPMQLKYSMAIANAVSTAWQTWQSGLTGTLMYPAFAAFPGPMAPPMPAIPQPFAAFSSPGESQFSPSTLKSAMEANFGDPTALHATELFESLAKAFNVVFQMYKPMTLVLLVLGMGPIPTFAPPFVPVGPVAGGSSIPTPGALLTIPLPPIPGPTGEYMIELTPFKK